MSEAAAYAARVRAMVACPVCADLFPTQLEADLCSPRADWARRYPARLLEAPYVSAFGPVA